VAVALQYLHQRPEHEDVSGVREVDPDAHEDPCGRDARPRIESRDEYTSGRLMTDRCPDRAEGVIVG
jgi:hypothetical protein